MISKQRAKKVIDYVSLYGKKEAAKHFKVSLETIKDYVQRFDKSKKASYGYINKEGQREYIRQDVRDNEMVVESLDHRICNVPDLLKSLKVDESEWYVDRHVINKYEVGMRNVDVDLTYDKGKVSGHSIQDPKPVISQLIQIKAWLKRNTSNTVAKLWKETIEESLKNHVPKYPEIPKRKKRSDYMLFVRIPDRHTGGISNIEESGALYNAEIACNRTEGAVNEIINMASPFDFEKIIYTVGDDEVNADNLKGQTTRGTPVETQSMIQKIIQKAQQSDVNCIDRLLSLADVEVIQLPGNHDELISWVVANYLQGHYRECKNVVIDNELQPRKYRVFGNTLIGISHGRFEKAKNLPIIMAQECRKKGWSDTLYSEFFIADKHHKNTKMYDSEIDLAGISVRRQPSISENSKWGTQHGFISVKAAEGYVYHKERGLTAVYPIYMP